MQEKERKLPYAWNAPTLEKIEMEIDMTGWGND